MRPRRLAGLIVALALVSCSEDAPVAPGTTHHGTADVAAAPLETFSFQATLDPYRIHKLPDFMVHSKARSEIYIQRSRFTGIGGWHTHPGLSYAYVLQGHIKLQTFSEKNGCSETRVYGPGDVYIKPPNELHRAIAVGEEEEWELIVRLGFPAGGPVAETQPDPGC